MALGFGAQNLVKDFIAGLFMLLEDQYGVGDVVDVGEAIGAVEAVGLRITTVRDGRGVLWYIRNGEIIRVGNKSQGWAMVVIDVPIGFAGVEEATAVLRTAAAAVAADPEYAADFVEPPQVLGVEQITVDGAVIRTIAQDHRGRRSGECSGSCAAGSPRRWRPAGITGADRRRPGCSSGRRPADRQPT